MGYDDYIPCRGVRLAYQHHYHQKRPVSIWMLGDSSLLSMNVESIMKNVDFKNKTEGTNMT